MQTESKIPLQFSYQIKKKLGFKKNDQKKKTIPSEIGKGPILYYGRVNL